jgi:hypothetical protein
MADKGLVIDPSPDQAFNLEKHRLKLSAGVLGAFFGTGPNVPLYIAGFTILILLFGGFAAMFFQSTMPAAEYWKFAGPAITASLGFIFGRKG